MQADQLLFELRTEEGNEYRLFLDGRVEGFPADILVVNHALPLFYKLQSLSIGKENIPAAGIANKQADIDA